ncbi:uncharacterized protein NDAI_0F00940 [Naumovozyma dairenensis CBS 421]|uniref:Uncharacterized protein n=1 Tax=Naumovozyma dairenensis (strain ATCC 10597 / BCRC 20456 / CBS 421 / NBRC 0211 / NRRL Y-12639) TaxID=1071378 RepID=G0WCA2_NAUDC|nr:hypothetical protein NDAI_0F00940 [Naumovozyma dairenensis CBS 421]CCD25413.1 hypothetical protein NDAI_0F00940 [Naumovozyma dairenensis CBS 421]
MTPSDQDETLRTTYRRLQLIVDYPVWNISEKDSGTPSTSRPGSRFQPCVSFNTVPSLAGISYSTDEETEEDDELERSRRKYKSLMKQNIPVWINSKDEGKPQLKAYSDVFRVSANGEDQRIDFPSRPMIMNDAIVMNKVHPLWRKNWKHLKDQVEIRKVRCTEFFKLPDILFVKDNVKVEIDIGDGYVPKSKEQRRFEEILKTKINPTKAPRTILCHISGRRHTWVAIDWLFTTLSQDLDHIVIIANLPKMITTMTKKQGKKDGYIPKDEWTSGYSEARIREKLNSIVDYISLIVPDDKIIKITIEIIVGKTKRALIDVFNVYNPDLVVGSTLRWRRTENLVEYTKTRRLIDNLCRRFPIPIFIIPAKRMFQFEMNLQKQLTLPSNIPGVRKAALEDIHSIPIEFSMLPSSDSLTAGYTKGDESPPNIPSDTNTSSEEDDEEKEGEEGMNEEKSVRSFRTVDSVLSAKRKLCLMARAHRKDMLDMLNSVQFDPTLTHEQQQLKKVDVVLNKSLIFSLEIDEMNQEVDDDQVGFERLAKVITGGKQYAQQLSMTAMANNPPKNIMKKGNIGNSMVPPSSASASSQIKFARDVKHQDGTAALRTPRKLSYQEYSEKIMDSIRRFKSTGGLRSSRSNDSVKSAGSSKSAGSTLFKKSGFLSFLKNGNSSNSSNSRSESISRRSSTEQTSMSPNVSNLSSSKKISKLFSLGKK